MSVFRNLMMKKSGEGGYSETTLLKVANLSSTATGFAFFKLNGAPIVMSKGDYLKVEAGYFTTRGNVNLFAISESTSSHILLVKTASIGNLATRKTTVTVSLLGGRTASMTCVGSVNVKVSLTLRYNGYDLVPEDATIGGSSIQFNAGDDVSGVTLNYYAINYDRLNNINYFSIIYGKKL